MKQKSLLYMIAHYWHRRSSWIASHFDYYERNPKFACFECRKSFVGKPSKCPNCGGEIHNMGTRFKAPKRDDEKQWQAVQMLYEGGVRYNKLSHDGWRLPDGYQKGDWEAAGLWHLLEMNGIGDYTPDIPVWKPPLFQWSRPRPLHPRDVPAYLDWWYDQIRERIRMVLDVCEEMGIPKPVIVENEAVKGRLKLK